MKKLTEGYAFTAEQQNNIEYCASRLSLSRQFVEILFERGEDSLDKIKRFLQPTSEHYINPFLLTGMRQAVEIIVNAKRENGFICVFGDYDADGVCAAAIISKAFTDYGVDFAVVLPERAEGYGLSADAVDRLIDKYSPTVIMTVDCGISNADEIEHIKSKGVIPLVTDHHELPPALPDCVCVNPKLSGDYPYDNLCGAGVAFKLACALLGDAAYPLADYAALATIADSVPLKGENRDITSEGLKLFNNSLRLAFKYLLANNEGQVTAQSLSYGVAPKINAAGRMGSAELAYKLLVSSDEKEIKALSDRLTDLNVERQNCCDVCYKRAKELLDKEDCYSEIIMLYDEGWNGGLVGIVAAKLAEEYNRPALLFTGSGEKLKGSARSIRQVNIFEALSACRELIAEFGGHSQAAGVNVEKDKFFQLKVALINYVRANYSEEIFVPEISVAADITDCYASTLARELNMLEPCGVGNRRPYFSYRLKEENARPVKEGSPHLKIAGALELMYFNGADSLKLINSDLNKKAVIELNLSTFRGKEYVKGYVKEIIYEGGETAYSAAVQFNNLSSARFYDTECAYTTVGEREALSLIKQKRAENRYGLAVIASSESVTAAYPDDLPIIDVFKPNEKNLLNRVIISPVADIDLSAFRDIIFLDKPLGLQLFGGFLPSMQGKNLYVCDKSASYTGLSVEVERESLLRFYNDVKTKFCAAEDAYSCATVADGFDVGILQSAFALEVFCELNLISFEGGRLIVNRGAKSDLAASKVYQTALFIKRSAD